MIEVIEETIYSIKDCRNISRAEMIGMVAFDIYKEPKLENKKEFLSSFMYDWTLKCDPKTNSSIHEGFVSDEKYIIKFIPNNNDGIIIEYITPTNHTIITTWDIEDIESFCYI